jgi:hypothetical protein
LLVTFALHNLCEQAVLAAVFLALFIELLLDGRQIRLQCGDGVVLGGEVAVYHERRRNKVGL